MNKRTLIAGFIVLAIGIAIEELAYHFGLTTGRQFGRILALLSIFDILVLLAGVILIIYGAIQPDPPVHWDNNL